MAIFGVTCLLASRVVAGDALVRVSFGDARVDGRVLSLGTVECTIMDRYGRLIPLAIDDIASVQPLGGSWKGADASAQRQLLIDEFGRESEVVNTRHYVICAPRGTARSYARLFERVYSELTHYFSLRSFSSRSPEMPLVAVILPTSSEFYDYARRDGVRVGSDLRGYYSLITNRIVLYHETGGPTEAAASSGYSDRNYKMSSGEIGDDQQDTIIHETVHQVAFNIGLHNRIGDNPHWLVEGFATVLEADAVRRFSDRDSAPRINRERLQQFRKLSSAGPFGVSIRDLIVRDVQFERNTLDAYGAAWALSFYLMEHPRQRTRFGLYLKTIADRDPLQAYTPQQRLRDFEAAFGDISELELGMQRYLERL